MVLEMGYKWKNVLNGSKVSFWWMGGEVVLEKELALWILANESMCSYESMCSFYDRRGICKCILKYYIYLKYKNKSELMNYAVRLTFAYKMERFLK